MGVNKKKLHPKVIFYIYNTRLPILGPFLNSIKLWYNQGYSVTVFSKPGNEKTYGRISPEIYKCFTHHGVKNPFLLNLVCVFFRGIAYLSRKLGLPQSWRDIAYFLDELYFLFYCYRKTNKKEINILIAVDPISLLSASFISKKSKSPYIYFCQELLLSQDAKRNIFLRVAKYIERKSNKNALYTVEFDENRAELLRKDNKLTPESMLVIPNAPLGNAQMERNYYFNEKFQIPKDKKIALLTGGIGDYNQTYEIVESITTWPSNVVLVIHCWGTEEQIDNLKGFAGRFGREIYFSTDMLLFEEIEIIYSSSDIGFALYGGRFLNHKYAGFSSGRLFNFMKACVPIITNNTSIYRESIGKAKWGVCIDNPAEIGKAIAEILDKEKEYKQNCLKTFPKFAFEKNHQTLINLVERYVQGNFRCSAPASITIL